MRWILFIFFIFLMQGCVKSTVNTDDNTVISTTTEEDGQNVDNNTDLNDDQIQNDNTITSSTSSDDINSETTTPEIVEDYSYQYEPLFYQQWYIQKDSIFYQEYDINDDASIHANGILQSYSAKDVVIAVIDNGFDVNHPDLQNAVMLTYNAEENSTDVSHTKYNEYHGTSVAGIIAARVNEYGISGIAYNSKLILIKLDMDDYISNLDIIEAFDYASKHGAWVINNSWGTGRIDDSIADKINEVAENGRNGKGTIIVFASGNDDISLDDSTINDESELENVLGVGATQKDNFRAYYSNYGSKLDIVAPGGDENLGIMTIDPINFKGLNIGRFNDSFLYADYGNLFVGTSAAAPVVSGAVAVLLGAYPNLTREEVFDILKRSSDKIGDIGYEELPDGTSRNDYYGYGKINLSKAMELAKQYK